MKKFKISLAVILVMVFAAGSAFTTQTSLDNEQGWFKFEGTPPGHDDDDPESYGGTSLGTNRQDVEEMCPTGAPICAGKFDIVNGEPSGTRYEYIEGLLQQ